MANSIEFTDLKKDAIGEIMNISMGSAATAASDLLNAKVWITTPRVDVRKAREVEYHKLEPAVCVKITYIKGLTGSNLMVWKQDDVQLILNQLMGLPLVVSPDFEFDEMNISAVSEVMNQMMGASATALTNFLGFSIDISTPTPYVLDEVQTMEVNEFDPDDDVVAITFNLTIDGVIKSEFVSVMSVSLADSIANQMLGGGADIIADNPPPVSAPAPEPTPAPAPEPAPAPVAAQPAPAPVPQQMPQPMPQQMPQMQPMPQQDMNMQYAAYGQPPYGYPYPPMQQPYGYGYPQQPVQPINIQNAQLHQFESYEAPQLSGEQKDNLNLLMDVPLQISVEIGTARRKVKDILEFTQGTIVELERQAGAPVDVVVNGNLIAKGDVVVIDDNFAVRITEIIKSKFMDSLGKE